MKHGLMYVIYASPNLAEVAMVRFEGSLSKFTNVVKGWQYRWFVLDMNNMVLEYYLLEEKDGKCRGRQGMEGALILPSEEDNNTFS